MKGFIKDAMHSFKSKPFRTIWALLSYPLLILLILATSIVIMVGTLSVENGIEWLKEAWI